MRALHVCYDLSPGGVTTFVEDLLALNEEFETRHDVLLIGVDRPEQETGHRFASHFTWRRFGRSLSRIGRILSRYDVAFLHSIHPVVVAALLLNRSPRVFLFQHGMTVGHGSRLKRRLARLWYSLAPRILRAKVVCATPGAAKKLRRLGIRVPRHGILIVPFGIRLPVDAKMLPADFEAQGIHVGMAGRLVASKRFVQALKCLETFAPRHRFVFEIAGEGPLRTEIEDVAASIAGPNIEIRLLGQVEDMAPFYERLALFIHPGKDESFGLVVVEALSRAIPVIACRDMEGAIDLVADGEGGFVLDSLNDLPATLGRIDDDPELIRSIQTRIIRARCARYDIRTTRRTLEEIAQRGTT